MNWRTRLSRLMDCNTSTFGPAMTEEDVPRILTQQDELLNIMLYRGWFTLLKLHGMTGIPEASISSHLRHMRKAKFGRYIVNKRRVDGRAIWEYQCLPPLPDPQQDLLIGGRDGA